MFDMISKLAMLGLESAPAQNTTAVYLVPLLVVFGVTYVLIASEKVDKTIAACLGAAAAIMLHHVPSYEEALSHVDLNVIFLLVGMMVIVNVLSTTGLFQWVAVTIARAARGNGPVILCLPADRHGRAVGVPGQRHDRHSHLADHDPDLPGAGDRGHPRADHRGDLLEHRRHGHAGRRPAEHSHRLAGRGARRGAPRPATPACRSTNSWSTSRRRCC